MSSRRASPRRNSLSPSRTAGQLGTPGAHHEFGLIRDPPSSPQAIDGFLICDRDMKEGNPEMGLEQVYDRITGATNRLTDIRVDQFSGEGDSDIVNWLDLYEDMALARRWDGSACKEQLPSFFTGPARLWLSARRLRKFESDIPLANIQGLTWGELRWAEVREVLLLYFLPRNYRDHLRDCLQAKQKKNENVMSFFSKKVYYGTKLERSDEEIINIIKGTLRPELQYLATNCEVKSLSGLLNRLKECELTIKRNPMLVRNLTGDDDRDSRSHHRGKSKDERHSDEESLTRSPERPSDSLRNMRENRRCYNCCEYGHISRDCRNPKKPDEDHSPTNSSIRFRNMEKPGPSQPSSTGRVMLISIASPKLEIEVNKRETPTILDPRMNYWPMDCGVNNQHSSAETAPIAMVTRIVEYDNLVCDRKVNQDIQDSEERVSGSELTTLGLNNSRNHLITGKHFASWTRPGFNCGCNILIDYVKKKAALVPLYWEPDDIQLSTIRSKDSNISYLANICERSVNSEVSHQAVVHPSRQHSNREFSGDSLDDYKRHQARIYKHESRVNIANIVNKHDHGVNIANIVNKHFSQSPVDKRFKHRRTRLVIGIEELQLIIPIFLHVWLFEMASMMTRGGASQLFDRIALPSKITKICKVYQSGFIIAASELSARALERVDGGHHESISPLNHWKIFLVTCWEYSTNYLLPDNSIIMFKKLEGSRGAIMSAGSIDSRETTTNPHEAMFEGLIFARSAHSLISLNHITLPCGSADKAHLIFQIFT